MNQVSAAWSEQARKNLGENLSAALEAFAHNATVREIIKIHGPETVIWVQSAEALDSAWTIHASYAAPEGDAIHFKVVLPSGIPSPSGRG